MSVELRNFIVEHFNRDELLTFCADYFRDFYEDNEGNPITKAALARDLIEHCQRRNLIDALKANLQKERPDPFERKFGRAVFSAVQPQPRNPQQVFLSYSTHDLRFAQRFAADLRAEGVPVWAAFDSIRPGESWTNAIDRGLSESGIFVVLLTPNSVNSQWVKTEVQFAVQEQQSREGRLVPLMIQTCNVRQLSALLTTIQHVDFANGYEQGLAQTFIVLGLPAAASRIWNAITERQAEEERKQREQLEIQRAKEAEALRLAEERKQQDELEAKRLREAAATRQAEEERKQREQLAAEQKRQEELEAERLREAAALRQAEEKRKEREQQAARQAVDKKQTEEEQKQRKAIEYWQALHATTGPLKIEKSSTLAEQQPKISRRALLIGAGGLSLAGLGVGAIALFTNSSGASRATKPTTASTVVSTAMPTAAPTIAPNATPGVELAPGVTMKFVHVPEGEFLMGSDKAKDPHANMLEIPQHRVFLSEYEIGKYEVTNLQYSVFAKDVGRKFALRSGMESHPVVNVTWEDANQFASWLSRKSGYSITLPTEAQWEKAARGTDGRIYPWGNNYNSDFFSLANKVSELTTPIGSFSPVTDSPYGVADMGSNVFEWTADGYNTIDEMLYEKRASMVVKNPTGLVGVKTWAYMIRSSAGPYMEAVSRVAFRMIGDLINGPTMPTLGFRLVRNL